MTDKPAPVVPPLTSIYMYASGVCNLNCSHCWINPEFQKEGTTSSLHLKLELVKKAVDQGKPLGLNSVKLTGGEPLLNPNISDIITFLSNEGIRIIIETNGTLVDNKMASFLAATENFRFISVSLDGSNSKIHDELRGVEGSFVKAVDGIRELVKVGIKPQIICTVNRDNLSQTKDVILLAIKLGAGSVKFNHVQPAGRAKDYDKTKILTVSELIEFNQYIEEEIIPNSNIIVFPDIPFAFQKPARFLRNIPSKCNIHNIIALLANGDLALCGIGTSVEEFLYGNIEIDSLEEVWKNSPKLVKLRELIPNELEGICSNCIHRSFCKGTCVAGNYSTGGKINSPYHFCETAAELGVFPRSRMVMLHS